MTRMQERSKADVEVQQAGYVHTVLAFDGGHVLYRDCVDLGVIRGDGRDGGREGRVC